MAKGNRQPVYLNHKYKAGNVITVREDCCIRRNLAWICWHRDSSYLSFKAPRARGAQRCLLEEVNAAGGNVIHQQNYVPAVNGRTHCHEGSGYEGRLRFRTNSEAVGYLKQYYKVIACSGNTLATQEWIDAR